MKSTKYLVDFRKKLTPYNKNFRKFNSRKLLKFILIIPAEEIQKDLKIKYFQNPRKPMITANYRGKEIIINKRYCII